MSNTPIIRSLLDNDLYKFTMMQAVWKNFPNTQVEYKFFNRGDEKLGYLAPRLRLEVKRMSELRLTNPEGGYLRSLRFFDHDFVDHLRGFQLDDDDVIVEDRDGRLEITIVGSWYNTILWEVPLLAIISELYHAGRGQFDMNWFWHASDKAQESLVNGIDFADFGTRRRYSHVIQDKVDFFFSQPGCKNFMGTSNLYFAKKYGLTPIGTMAHEWIMAGIGLAPTLRLAQPYMLEAWAQTYRGDLGIALTDTFGIDFFLKDFDLFFAKLYDGVRHDSGSPYAFVDKITEHYRKLGIDPMTKTIVFSDGLNMDRARGIKQYCDGRIRSKFGIGTNLTNDCGDDPLKIVIKMTKCNDVDVFKVSDESKKTTIPDLQTYEDLVTVYDAESAMTTFREDWKFWFGRTMGA